MCSIINASSLGSDSQYRRETIDIKTFVFQVFSRSPDLQITNNQSLLYCCSFIAILQTVASDWCRC